jgi:hypothetical protein
MLADKDAPLASSLRNALCVASADGRRVGVGVGVGVGFSITTGGLEFWKDKNRLAIKNSAPSRITTIAVIISGLIRGFDGAGMGGTTFAPGADASIGTGLGCCVTGWVWLGVSIISFDT